MIGYLVKKTCSPTEYNDLGSGDNKEFSIWYGKEGIADNEVSSFLKCYAYEREQDAKKNSIYRQYRSIPRTYYWNITIEIVPVEI